MKTYISLLLAALLMFSAGPALSQDLLPTEDDFFKILTLPVPEGIVLEVGGMALLPNGDLAVATRRGDVWVVENPYDTDMKSPKYRLYATGLHELLGLAYVNGDLIAAQRGELTRLKDTNGDGRADGYEPIYVVPVSGHYHEYTFGPIVMPDGSMFITGNVAFGDQEWWRGESRVPWRGWAMRISPDGKMEPWATGMRSPCGIGIVDGKFFYGDNQGDWMGSGFITVVERGDFMGHPAGLRWTGEPGSPLKLTTEQLYARVDGRLSPPGKPTKPENVENETPNILFEVERDIPEIKTPSVWLPHGIQGISTSQILEIGPKSSFAPFAGQLLVGDQGQSKIVRVFLEQVNGVYQGASFAFREGFQSGVLRMEWGRDGSLFVGETNRGWGSVGKDAFGLQRLVWTGKTPFEMKSVRAMADGFEIEFTEPVDSASAANPESYKVTGFIYKYHPVYGSPVINDSLLEIWAAVVSPDKRRVRLVVDGIRKGYIHELKVEGVKAVNRGLPLLHNTAYYTLNEIPNGPKLNVTRPMKQAPAPAMDHSAHRPPAPTAKTDPAPAPAPAKPTVMGKRTTKMPADWGKPDVSISLGTVPGLKYDKTFFTVKAGSKVKWTFRNVDDMPHNCVIVNPGTADAIGQAALNLGLKGEAQGYVPVSKDVLFHTRLVGPGASETIYFVAPTKPGLYTFVCTYPGHATIMRGVLQVQ